MRKRELLNSTHDPNSLNPSEQLATAAVPQETRPPQLPDETEPDVAEGYVAFEKSGKYPRSNFYLSEAIVDLCQRLYMSDIEDIFEKGGIYTSYYLPKRNGALEIVFSPADLDEKYNVIPETFNPDIHDAIRRFMHDLDTVTTDKNVTIDCHGGDFLTIKARSPMALFKVIEDFVIEFEVATKDYAFIEADETDEQEEQRQQERAAGWITDKKDPLRQSFLDNTREGMEYYKIYAERNAPEGNPLLRFISGRAFSSLDHAIAVMNIANRCAMKSSIEELRAIVAEETGTGMEYVRGYNLSN